MAQRRGRFRTGGWRIAAAGVLTLLAGGAPAGAQIELGAVQGTVLAEDGAPLRGVTVVLRDPDRGSEVRVETNDDGRFYRRGLRAIEYELVVEKEGYQPIHDRLRLSAGTEQRFNFTLVRAAPVGAEEFTVGVEAFNRGDYEAAIRAFEAALEQAPGLPEIHVNLALAYVRLSRPSDAVTHLERAAALDPDDPGVLFQLGGAYVETNDLDKAIAAFERGLGARPDPADPLAYEATVTLGAAYFARGRNADAVARFRQAVAARPDDPAPRLGLGKCAFSDGQVDEALRYFKEVVASAPGTPEAAEAAAFIAEMADETRN